MGQIHGSFKVRDQAQRLLFEPHEKHFSDVPVPLLYHPKDTQRQNIMVTIPGPLVVDSMGRPDQQALVLKDVVKVPLKYAREVLSGEWGLDWALGYDSTQAKVSPLQTSKRFLSHIWQCQGWSTCTSLRG
ncbi:MAG: hypothetical protein AB2556_25180 [Candidatus Thiodiazotropha sp.]